VADCPGVCNDYTLGAAMQFRDPYSPRFEELFDCGLMRLLGNPADFSIDAQHGFKISVALISSKCHGYLLKRTIHKSLRVYQE
jgi:hypothetical protein